MTERASKPKTTKKKAAKTAATVIPPWPGISEEALQGLAEKLGKAKDERTVSKLIYKVNGDDYRTEHAIAWHLVQYGAVHPENNIHLFGFIAEHNNFPTPEVALDVLAKLPDGASKYYQRSTCLLDGYTSDIERMLMAVYQQIPEKVRERAKDFSPNLQLGLAFVQRRLGETIAPETSKAILEQLATHQAKDWGITLNIDVPYVENGQLIQHSLRDEEALRKITRLFGTDKEWEEALLAAALENDWRVPQNVWSAFLNASTQQLAQLMSRTNPSTGDMLKTFFRVIPQREDDPIALFEAGKTMTGDRTCREAFLTAIIYRAGKMGVPVPEKLEDELRFELLNSSYEGARDTGIEWCAALPRERALAVARRLLEDESWDYSRAVGILAVHFDEKMFRAALAKDFEKGYNSPETLGVVGAPGLAPLEWAYEKTNEKNRPRLHKAILIAMAKAAKTMALDERWERFIDFDREGGEVISGYSYGKEEIRARQESLLGISEPRRSMLLMKRAAETNYPGRVLQVAHLAADEALIDAIVRRMIEEKTVDGSVLRELPASLQEPVIAAFCRHIRLSGGDGRFMEKLQSALSRDTFKRVEEALQNAGIKKETPYDALVRMCNEGPEPKQRVYMLRVNDEDEGYRPKAGTLSRSGGNPPGIEEADYPKDKKGEPLTHLFTLDLEEIPELQAKYDGARALAAFCPEPESGERTEEFTLVPVSRAAAEALPNLPDDEEDDESMPIAIIPLDVPVADDYPQGGEIRNMIFNSAGHVFGQPFWIQEDEGSDGFLMQVNERLSRLNLGDSGSLYVFDWGTLFQCY